MNNSYNSKSIININMIDFVSKTLLKLKKLKLLLIIFPYIILASIVFYYLYQNCVPSYVKNGVKYTRNFCGRIKSAEKIPVHKNQNEKKVNAKVYTDSKIDNWEIIDISKNPKFPTGIKFSDKSLLRSTVVRWKNFLISINQEYYIGKSSGAYFGRLVTEHYNPLLQIRTVRVYNIDTGETFDISLDKPTWGEIWDVTSQIIDNTYYFGVGGSFGASLGYKLDLPPQRNSRIIKLPSTIGNSIEKYGNFYVGSVCYEGCSYALFDPVSLNTTPLKRMTEADNGYIFNRKEELLGIDSLGRMILNVRKIPKNSVQIS